jgi:hypothetical protein
MTHGKRISRSGRRNVMNHIATKAEGTVSILPAISKFVERTIFEQLSSFFENNFHHFLSAFRSGYGCQTALLKIIEDWKKALTSQKKLKSIDGHDDPLVAL